MLSCMHSLYILGINFLPNISLTNILSHFIDSPLVIFSLMYFCFCLVLFLYLLIFVCVSFAWRDIPKSIAKVNVKEHTCMLSHFSCVQLFVTLWAAACQASLSMRVSRHEFWSGLLCPPPRDLPDPRVQTHISYVFALAGRFFTTIAAWEVKGAYCLCFLLRRHMVSGLTANSLIHLSLFLYMVWGSSPVWFFCM